MRLRWRRLEATGIYIAAADGGCDPDQLAAYSRATAACSFNRYRRWLGSSAPISRAG